MIGQIRASVSVDPSRRRLALAAALVVALAGVAISSGIAAGEVAADEPGQALSTPIVVGAGTDRDQSIGLYTDQSGKPALELDPKHGAGIGGVRVAAGDVNGDGTCDIIYASEWGLRWSAGVAEWEQLPGGRGPKLQYDTIWDRALRGSPAGGVFVAAGDVNGDGRADVVTAAGNRVRVLNGPDGSPIGRYGPYNSRNGEVHPAAGDVDGDGYDEIILGTGRKVDVLKGSDGYRIDGVRPHGARNGEVYPAAGDVDGDGHDEIIVGVAGRHGARVSIFGGPGLDPVGGFSAHNAGSGELHPAAGDVDGDGRDEIIVAPGPGVRRPVTVFEADGTALFRLFPFGRSNRDGVYVAAGH